MLGCWLDSFSLSIERNKQLCTANQPRTLPYLQFFLSNHAILQVNAISDAEKVMKHFDNYRTKFSSLFSPPPLKKLNNPGYYRVPSSALGTPV